MAITDRFCPKCGQPSEREGLCSRCRAESVQWLSCDGRVQSVHCPACDARKVGSVWTDTGRDRESIAYDLVRSAVHIHPDVKQADVRIRIIDLTHNRSRAEVSVTGRLYGQRVEGSCETEIAWLKEQCDRCSRISGSYYEGVVQVRAEGRHPSPFEIQTAAAFADEAESALQTGGERLSFISDMTETRDGLDIVVGSQHIGLLIAQKVTAELGGRYTTHPKLVGEKNGKQLYRITYSVRLPRFQKRDVIRWKGRYAEVVQVEPHGLRVFDFAENAIRSVREDEVEKLVGNARQAEDAMVAYSDRDMIGIIDPVTSKTVESKANADYRPQAGQHVRILRDGDFIVILR
ncbi:MAG: NMD3 family protein [Methanoregula sp. PtaU1.Bin051]|nr:MAG: NMD3 family protein [Methanoregula sp. PtaU1.Bin051]